MLRFLKRAGFDFSFCGVGILSALDEEVGGDVKEAG
jgi:hypothetical protein